MLRVIDGISSQPLPEKRVNIWQWDPKVLTAHGKGGFRLEDSTHTDGNGCIQLLDRPAGELKAYTVNLHDRRAVARCLRPLAGQKVRLHMRVWPLTEDTLEYTWQAKSKLESLSQLTMHSVDDIQQLNPLQGLSELIPGTKITLPCYAASYRMEHWDTFDWIGKAFGYQDARGLAKIMRLKSPLYLDTGKDIELPDWHFFYARENDTLEQIDSLFGLPQGSSIAVGRVYHPDPRLPYTGETIAIPTASFAIKLKKMRKW